MHFFPHCFQSNLDSQHEDNTLKQIKHKKVICRFLSKLLMTEISVTHHNIYNIYIIIKNYRDPFATRHTSRQLEGARVGGWMGNMPSVTQESAPGRISSLQDGSGRGSVKVASHLAQTPWEHSG